MKKNQNAETLYDLRTLNYFINRGDVTPKAYEEYLQTLPDDEAQAEWFQINDEDPSEDFDSEDDFEDEEE